MSTLHSYRGRAARGANSKLVRHSGVKLPYRSVLITTYNGAG